MGKKYGARGKAYGGKSNTHILMSFLDTFQIENLSWPKIDPKKIYVDLVQVT